MSYLPGQPAAHPVSGQVCPVYAVDIEGFTRPGRDERTRLRLRGCLYGMLRKASVSCGLARDDGFVQVTGDGAVLVLPPGIAAQPLISPWPDRLRHLIRHHDKMSSDAARIRLRVAVSVGPVHRDQHGVTCTGPSCCVTPACLTPPCPSSWRPR
jgi:hypothetical protein